MNNVKNDDYLEKGKMYVNYDAHYLTYIGEKGSLYEFYDEDDEDTRYLTSSEIKCLKY